MTLCLLHFSVLHLYFIAVLAGLN